MTPSAFTVSTGNNSTMREMSSGVFATSIRRRTHSTLDVRIRHSTYHRNALSFVQARVVDQATIPYFVAVFAGERHSADTLVVVLDVLADAVDARSLGTPV